MGWLSAACGGDDDLRTEVGRLLAQDERAERDGLLAPPAPALALAAVPPDGTASCHPDARARPPQQPAPVPVAGDPPVDQAAGLKPRGAIAPRAGPQPLSKRRSAVQARLRELPMIYILMLGIAIFWRRTILGAVDLTLIRYDMMIMMVLAGIVALLSSPWRIPLDWLKNLELGLVGLLAWRLSFGQYRLMLLYSLHDDPMMAPLVMNNVVLLTAILILTAGLYVPKSWQRAAMVVGPLALVPFATLLFLAVRHPEATMWLTQGLKRNPNSPRVLLLVFDTLILLMLAAGSTFGARAMSRLRREAAEARQLGQYRLQERLGAGGMGEVYLAEHQLLKRPCAVKLIRSRRATDPLTLAQFEREVRLTATLSHPNTVEVYDYGRTGNGSYYYAMEYLRGLSLAELVKLHGPLPPGRVVYLLRQVCGALREAHAAGLIHRDIKPSNIFAARRGGIDDMAKLLDFGMVRPVVSADAARLSLEGQILGTPQFMSPEQATGTGALDERSDIYSLGAVAYHLLTGRPPFDGTDARAVMNAQVNDPVVPPSRDRPGIPEDLERVVLRCLAKDPAERFADAGSLERALGACACAADWDQDRAAQWWQSANRFAPTRATVNRPDVNVQ
jgi:serine/threonine-protein kinase